MKKKQKKLSIKDYATDPNLSREVREFLKIVNTSGGPPLATLPLADAQAGLANAQASVQVDVSGVNTFQNSPPINLNHVKIQHNTGRSACYCAVCIRFPRSN